MKPASAPWLLLLLPLLALASHDGLEHDEPPSTHKHFINWDAYEFPIVAGFTWSRPFPDNGLPPMGFETKCNEVKTFHARNYKLGDLRQGESHELFPYSEAIQRFIGGRPYPGSWDGVDHGEFQRDLLMMNWRDVPKHVRQWIEEHDMRQMTPDGLDVPDANSIAGHKQRWRFLVFRKQAKKASAAAADTTSAPATETTPLAPLPTEGADRAAWKLPSVADRDKVVFFAPAQIYPILPLWAASGSKCEETFADLTKFVHQAKDDSVVAWPFEHSKPDRENGNLDIYFKIRAEHVMETPHGRDRRLLWDTILRHSRRSERKMTREERRAARGKLGEGGGDDDDDGVPERDEL